MNKTFLSLAFLTASGVYVAYANHALDGLTAPEARAEEQSDSLTGAAELPSKAATVQSSAPAKPVQHLPQLVASAEASAPPAATLPKLAPVIVSATPAPQPIPMPLPRPTTASVQQTQSVAAATSPSGYRDGSYTCTDENAYYGRVQVQVVVAHGEITGVKVLDYPSDRRTSRAINGQALPMLQREVIQAQNDQIDGVSGATLTSEAYIRSLGNALSKAGGSNA